MKKRKRRVTVKQGVAGDVGGGGREREKRKEVIDEAANGH